MFFDIVLYIVGVVCFVCVLCWCMLVMYVVLLWVMCIFDIVCDDFFIIFYWSVVIGLVRFFLKCIV